MTTIRVAKRERFTTVTRATVNDKNLSFRARGVLFWLLDKPNDWSVDAEAIARDGKEGREAVRTALRELEDTGYLVRLKTRNQDGTFRTDCWVYERPMSDSDQSGFLGSGLTSGNAAKAQVTSTTGNPSPDTRRRIPGPPYEDGDQMTETANGISASDCVRCHGTGLYIPETDDRHQPAVKCDHKVGALTGGQPVKENA